VSVPAIFFCNPEHAGLRIAALTVLDRLLVTAHRAGCRTLTVVCDGEMPPIPRSRALGIDPVVVRQPPKFAGPTLIATANLLVQRDDVEALLKNGGRLAAPDKKLLPIGVAAKLNGTVAQTLKKASRVVAVGVARRVEDHFMAALAEDELWETMGSATDGLVDKYFNRPAGRVLSKLLIHTPVTPNQVSVFATCVGVGAAVCLGRGDHRWDIIGALVLQLSAAVDCVDGDIARVMFKESKLGKWLDLAGDQVVHVALFVAIAVGLSVAKPGVPATALGVSAALGVLIAFGVVLRGMLHPDARGNTRLQRLIDATTNRDFSVLIIVLAFADRLDLFLWAAAIGVHGFWLLALGLQLRGRRAAGEAA
jgi:phosphatidylglycerophosphate synthase